MNSGQPTELPDSLEDGAQIAAQACANLIERQGGASQGGRCRIDFDTSVGDETYTLLKQSTEFMQIFVKSLCYLQMPELQQLKQEEMMRVVSAKTALVELEAELEKLVQAKIIMASKNKDNDNDYDGTTQQQDPSVEIPDLDLEMHQLQDQMDEQEVIVQRGGVDPDYQYVGPKARIYFPDEGSAALARRDWMTPAPLVPPCVEFSSCGGVQSVNDVSKDRLIFFFCPRASESGSVEKILQRTEMEAVDTLQLSVFVNPLLVDMGVTGFGMAGRLLRERLIDPLPHAYYLRTLPWGALTRVWPRAFSVWQEDETADGGYRLIRTLERLPSNPEVEDIYDIENGNTQEKKSGGMLDQFGDFVNGMMRL